MKNKPDTHTGYHPEDLQRVRGLCLYVATKLGDLLDDLVVVGGLVPSLLIDASVLPADEDAHIGTTDLDLGMRLLVLDGRRYVEIARRLRNAGFRPDINENNNPTRQRWMIDKPAFVTVDFLMPQIDPKDPPGTLRHLEPDFAAVITPGLELAFRDQCVVELVGRTLHGDRARRNINVAGSGAFVVLKALAFDGRGENKDAYDLYFVLRNLPGGPAKIATRLKPLINNTRCQAAIDILRRDFLDESAVGSRAVARFLTGQPNDIIQADVVGFVAELLSTL